jgi:hypothetical protein
MMTMLAFAPAVIPTTKSDADTTPALPTFKPRWWYEPDRLDARPVIWSLRNRPQEWEALHRGIFLRVRHKPSGHAFVADICDTGLEDGNRCGCARSTGKFQIFQNWAFRRAARAFRDLPENQSHHDPVHFASHFVHP